MNQETAHNFYYDNGVFIKLTAIGNEELLINHYDSLINHFPSIENQRYQICFTWSSLLEAIGLGNFRKKSTPKLELSQFYINRNDHDLEKKLDEAYHHAHQYFSQHPELSVDLLIDKIQKQINFFTSTATIGLVENTLGRYKNSLLTFPKETKESLVHNLVWDVICECHFANFNQIKNEDQTVIRKKTRKINEWLLQFFHDKHQELELSSYRLADKIQKELLSSNEYLHAFEKKEEKGILKVTIPYLLENKKDLGDIDVIHFATFGYEGRPAIVFTADKPEIIKQRITIQLSVMHFLCSAENSTLKLLPGLIFFVNSETCIIYDKLNVAEFNKEASIEIRIEDVKANRKRSLVLFGK